MQENPKECGRILQGIQKNPRSQREGKETTKLTTKSYYKQLARSISDHFLTKFQKNTKKRLFLAIFGYFWLFLALKRLKTCEFERKPDQLPENAENMRFMNDFRNTDNKLGVKSS